MAQNNHKKYRNSKQRTKILEILKSTKDHPTAVRIYEQLRTEFPALSLGNVYRNLNILVEQGQISELRFGSTFDRYDGDIRPHYHFICEGCGSIEDLDIEHEDVLNKKVEENTNYKVNHHRLEFYGQCENCLQ
ncbi:transcriptional repressor [candidate division KSB1 bacterium]|nr:transcriptional repressor [candidate division KSB1 bacterium]NIR71359.1 transcriptional repressor [candidate division KSB1 bacterium]NIS26249.1 transcriptional repressor [candidate division KSB1 bacterium]NIT73000.1 transcriptional repressor [candidate division KSB1 bacterium]NIU26897.1 transcriptional repressor [candidate division KSB1 bacterium]